MAHDARGTTPPDEADLLIAGGVVVTLNADRAVLDPGAVAIRGNQIVAVGDRAAVEAGWRAARRIDAGDGIVLPGLVNAHTHVAMTIFRGLADDLPLDVWLQQHIWPAEARFLSPDTVRWGAQLGAIELIRSGATTLCDMYFYEEEIAAALKAVGLRAVLSQGVLDFPTPQGLDVAENLAYLEAFLDRWRGDDLIVPAVGPHAPYTVSPELLRRCHGIAERHGAPLVIHVAETRREVEEITARYGLSPVRHLARLGVLDARMVAAHCVWVDPEEIRLLAASGVGVAHNPRSNLKLGSGIAPAPAMLRAGIALGLGTDSAASNNRLDLFAELEAADLIHKGVSLDPQAVPAAQAIELATLGGARALKLDGLIGSLEPGKRADLIVLDLDRPHLTPVYAPLSVLAYAATGADVRTSIIDGRLVMEDRRLLTIDEAEVRRQVRRIATDIRAADRRG